uniref:Uncharacterized protein n=1 Tax=Anguilla anguilla TaxID=7936 RepID=A0A0E9WGQ8_ANGAN
MLNASVNIDFFVPVHKKEKISLKLISAMTNVYISVCVCLCMCVCMYVRMYVCTFGLFSTCFGCAATGSLSLV